MLDRLEQIHTEETYSRKNIREYIYEEVAEESTTDCELILAHYLSKSYYSSKNIRIAPLWNVNHQEIVLDIFSVIFPLEGQQSIQNIVGQIGPLLGYEDITMGVKTASELVILMAETDLWDVHLASDSETGSITIESNYTLSDKTKQLIEKCKYLPPMVCTPDVVVDNNTSGYLTFNESVVLNDRHELPIGLDVLNIMNNTSLSIDEYMLEYIEESKKTLDTSEKRLQFESLSKESEQVYVDMLIKGNKFNMVHAYDSRGRSYCKGYHINYQGTQYKKSLINLHKKVIINNY
jgi:hypothetical protein